MALSGGGATYLKSHRFSGTELVPGAQSLLGINPSSFLRSPSSKQQRPVPGLAPDLSPPTPPAALLPSPATALSGTVIKAGFKCKEVKRGIPKLLRTKLESTERGNVPISYQGTLAH